MARFYLWFTMFLGTVFALASLLMYADQSKQWEDSAKRFDAVAQSIIGKDCHLLRSVVNFEKGYAYSLRMCE